jgi:hypothetical protein
VEQCKENLADVDYETINRFGSPDELLQDLKEKEENASNRWYSRVRAEVAPVLKVLKEVSTVFLLAMRPKSVEMTFLWGLLYLTIEVGLPRRASISSPSTVGI